MSKSNTASRPSSAIGRREFIKRSGGALVLSSVGLSSGAARAEARSQPNILLIITDQQHIDTIAAGGCSHANCGFLALDHALPLNRPGLVRKVIKDVFRARSPLYIKPRFSPSVWVAVILPLAASRPDTLRNQGRISFSK